MYRVAMKRGSGDTFSTMFRARNRDVLCVRGLLRVLDIPKDTKRIWAVFTKRPGPDKYTLKVTSTEVWWNVYRYGTVKESRATFMPAASEHIRRAVKKGYKYVHIEYEV